MKIRTLILSNLACWSVAAALAVTYLPSQSTAVDAAGSNILRATAGLLEHSQFAHQRLDTQLSGKFLDGYLDALDSGHLLFLQSDVDEFNQLRPDLARLTRREGDTRPARQIFDRYLERLAQREAFATNLLATATFDFTGDDTWQADRRTAPRPRDLDGAQSLWRQQVRAEYLQEKLAGRSPADIVSTLTRRYTRLQQTLRKLTPDEVLGSYLDALAHVYDPHSDYLSPEELESFSIAMNLSLYGIGATLQFDDGYCVIRELVPGGPAALSGLIKTGDRIVAVAQDQADPVDVVDLPLSQTVELVRGPKGTNVRLTLMPSGAPESTRKTITLVRDKIRLEDQRAKASLIDLPRLEAPPLRLGVIDLPSFYGQADSATGTSASEDVARLITRLKAEGVRGILLDLRRNGGGSLEESIRLTGLFIRQGPVVQTRDARGDVEVGNDPDRGVLYQGPLVVLTSRLSASASEILAGALQDYGRAVIVGDSSTFGKGTVQTLVPLAPLFEQNGISHSRDPGAVKLTIAKFYRPGGTSTQLRGVSADVVLPSPTDVADISERQMTDPLPWDAVRPARFAPLNLVQPFLPALQRASAKRVAAEPAFQALEEEIASAADRRERGVIVLNEAERRREKDEAETREAALQRALEARSDPAPTVYAITLQNVDQPGLRAVHSPADTSPSAPDGEDKPEPGAAAGFHAGDAVTALVLREAQEILADYVSLTASASARDGIAVHP